MLNKVLNVLIADDDEDDLELIEEAITGLRPDIALHKVKDGKSVIQYLEALPGDALPCLLILDYNMPIMNGAEVLAKISGQPRYAAMPVIILSTSNAPLHLHECKANGAADYLVKPNTREQLDTLARQLIAYCKPE